MVKKSKDLSVEDIFSKFEPKTEDVIKKKLKGQRGLDFANRLIWIFMKGKLGDGILPVTDVGRAFKVSGTRVVQILDDFVNLGLIEKSRDFKGHYYLVKSYEKGTTWEIEKYIDVCKNFINTERQFNNSDR